MSLLARFIAANRRVSMAIEALLPAAFKRHLHTVYKYEVAALINRRPGQLALDIGGGKDCPFVPFIADPQGHLIVALDCAEEELRRNRSVEARIVADAATEGWPIRGGAVDIVVSRSVMEHLHDNAAFLGNCARALRPGGVMVHTFPCKFAPFALINQLLPNRASRRLIAWFQPQWQDDCGFLAFYDRLYFSSLRDMLASHGFVNAKFTFRYYQSIYFDFFFPLYLAMLLYDLVAAGLGIRNLACAILVTAERPASRDAAVPQTLSADGRKAAGSTFLSPKAVSSRSSPGLGTSMPSASSSRRPTRSTLAVALSDGLRQMLRLA